MISNKLSSQKNLDHPTMLLSVIIVNWNTVDLLCNCLRSCLQSLQESAIAFDGKFEIIVIDNHSSDGSVSVVRQSFPIVQIIENQENVGFARANNQGIAASIGEYILLLNSDTIVPNKTLSALLDYMTTAPYIGIISPQLLRPDGTAQPFAYGSDPTPGYLMRRVVISLFWKRSLHDWNVANPIEVDWVSGACMLVRRTAIEQVGGLDEKIFMYFEDNDWCHRIRQTGWKVFYYPNVAITHIGGQSLKRNPQAQAAYYSSLRYFYRKHYGWVAQRWLDLFLPLYRMRDRDSSRKP